MFWKKKKKDIFPQIFAKDIEIVDYLPDGILVLDKKNRVLLANKQVEKFFEVKEGDLLNKEFLKLGKFKKMKEVVSLLGGGVKEVEKEEVEITKSLILEVTVVPISAGDEEIGKLIVFHDITKEKLVEKTKTEFVTWAAHQLRTPTSAVKWSLKEILEEDAGKLTEKQKKILQKAYETNDKAIKVINDLLNVAQIEEGYYLSDVKLCDVVEIIQSIIKEQSRLIEEKNLKVSLLKPEEEIPKIMLDAEKIKLAISNIVNNAIKYTPSGGKIEVSVKKVGKRLEISIKDTGVGIPKEEEDMVFKKFFRGSNIKKFDTTGTGLGLYIAKNIIEAHEGEIWFFSEENKGTTFFIALPIKKEFGEFITGKFY